MRVATETATFKCDGCGKRCGSAAYHQGTYLSWIDTQPVRHYLAACSEMCMQQAIAQLETRRPRYVAGIV